MWEDEEFIHYLKGLSNEGCDIFNKIIKPKMKEIILWSIESVKNILVHKKETCELLGFDFMIDTNYNTWLLEINSSPALDYSTVNLIRKLQKN